MARTRRTIRGFGDGLLSPDHFRRRFTRLVSYYALFKGMAASKPTSQLSRQIHILSFSTEPVLRDLSRRSGFLPSRARRLARVHCLPGLISRAFGVCLGSVGCEPPSPMQCSTSRRRNARGRTSIRFGENQLSPSLIGLSPLPTAHPSGFQPTTVRPSTGLYPSFSLAMGRSLRFRVCPRGLRPSCESHALFRLAFAPAPVLNTLASPARSNSPDHNAKGTQSPTAPPKRHHRLPPLVGTRFQVLFHSPPGVLFTFPSRYSCTIGRGRVFSLGGWSPQIQPGLLEPRPTRVPAPPPATHSAYRALTCYGGPFQAASARMQQKTGYAPHRPHNPAGPKTHGLGSSPFARHYSGNLN